MAALLGNVDETPEMRQEIEAMMQELGAAADTEKPALVATDSKSTATPSVPAGGENDFQETIRKTMERMQNSGEQASAAAAADDSDDILAQMLKEMQSGGGDGSGDEEGFSKMLMGMMEQLTNKEILYEPMKELHDKFPEWMRKNKDVVSKDDLKRYEDQQRYVSDIVAKFDEKGYSDSKAADRQYIVERMQQVSETKRQRKHHSNSIRVDAGGGQPSAGSRRRYEWRSGGFGQPRSRLSPTITWSDLSTIRRSNFFSTFRAQQCASRKAPRRYWR